MAPSARSNKVGLNEISQPCRSLRGFRLGTASAPRLKMIRCVTICHYVSLRGKRNFRLTWQSRGSALIKFFTAYHPCILENVPPTCLHDKTNCNNHYPVHPPLTVKERFYIMAIDSLWKTFVMTNHSKCPQPSRCSCGERHERSEYCEENVIFV